MSQRLIDQRPCGNADVLPRSHLLFFVGCLTLRVIAGIIKAGLPHDLPHRWREIDTYGVAVRYWIRWSHSTPDLSLFLPAVLGSGDAYGIMPMEFPLFSLLAAPFVAAGPVWGYFLAHLAMFTFNAGLLLYCALLWDRTTLSNVPMKLMCLSLAVVTVASGYLSKFMPDFLSLVLVLIAVSGAWNRSWLVRSFAFATLGLLIKPTTLIVFGVLLLHPDFRSFIRRQMLWIVPATAVAITYYTFGIKFLETFQDLPGLYAVKARPVIGSLVDFFTEPRKILVLVTTKLMFAPGLFLVLLVWPFSTRGDRIFFGRLFMVLGLQMFAIAALAGEHVFVHEYYFIGCAPVLSILIWKVYLVIARMNYPVRLKKVAAAVFAVLILATVVDRLQFDVRSLVPAIAERYLSQRDCLQIKVRNPDVPWDQDRVFRSANGFFPETGVCFHEREGSTTSRYGILTASAEIPDGCKALDREGSAVLIDCRK